MRGEPTDREREIMETLARITEAPDVFAIGPGEGVLSDPRWPDAIARPTSDEVRQLVHREFLEVDRSAAPTWRFFMSPSARIQFADDLVRRRAEALKDPDQRLGVILDAIVDAFEKDPSEPFLLIRTSGPDLIRHPQWAIEPDVARLHDLRQLEDLRLIGWQSATQFYPTPAGRSASRNPAVFLSQRADETRDEAEQSRLRRAAEKLRVGDVAVGAAGGLSSAAIRILLGL